MKVWRVAHKAVRESGFPTGPYSCSGLDPDQAQAVWNMAGDHSDGRHPTPYADPELWSIQSHERCGFASPDDLNGWFDGWGDALSRAGFAVYVYDVPDWAARVGRFGQVVFAADEAVELERYDFAPEQLTLFP
ncbi:hypothetical protein SEA_SHAWTY_37 [Streptomyces phage Shawty]|uniref:Uncharacterized protein n=1 Tax=Streptomyces phage Shawty TaxID=2510521 RepID=A0A411CYH8_9CAUD|nr:hypothetical protein SEA_SHAWTY_37 [Streptomyces phage Shawty]